MLRNVGVEIGQRSTAAALERLPARALAELNKRVGYRLVAKAGEKGVVNLTKLVPLVGGPIGAAVDGVSCKTIAGYAMRTFTPVVPRVLSAGRDRRRARSAWRGRAGGDRSRLIGYWHPDRSTLGHMTGAMRYIRPFADLGRGDLADAGGKGANLGELTRAGLPVPPGFVLTTAAYRAFVAGIGDEVLRLADLPRDAEPAAYDEPARRIHALFVAAPVPDDIAAELRVARAALGAGRRRPLLGDRRGPRGRELRRPAGHVPQRPRRRRAARRRRATAGRRCGPPGRWPTAARREIDPGAGRAGRRRAGDGRRRRRGGAVHREPDQRAARRGRGRRRLGARRGGGQRGGEHRRHRRRARRPGACCRATTADKAVMTVCHGDGGTAERPVPARPQRTRPVLDDAAAAALAALGARIEEHFGAPQDIEWARAGGDVLRSSSPARSRRCREPDGRRRRPTGRCPTRRRSTCGRASSSSCPTR